MGQFYCKFNLKAIRAWPHSIKRKQNKAKAMEEQELVGLHRPLPLPLPLPLPQFHSHLHGDDEFLDLFGERETDRERERV